MRRLAKPDRRLPQRFAAIHFYAHGVFGQLDLREDPSWKADLSIPIREALRRDGKNNRLICLHLDIQRKRLIIKRISRLLSAYLVQSVHARITPPFPRSYIDAGIMIGQIRRLYARVIRRLGASVGVYSSDEVL
jgi:hypothetical protein